MRFREKVSLFAIGGKYGLYRHPEKRRKLKCEWQARVIFTFLNGVDGLSSHLQLIGKIGLSPIATRP
jgi:hypothetical protein